MRTLKHSLILHSGLLTGLLLSLMLQSCSSPLDWNATDISGMMPDLKFSLTGPDGEAVNATSLHGKSTLVFFGFTHCPEVCPTTLARLKVAILSLGSSSDEIQVVLVSVDPDRDTPEVMKRYTAPFGSWLLGLTGSDEALTTLRKSYGVYAAMESSTAKGSYNVMHNAAVFAFDKKGHARLLISDLSDSAALLADLQQLIEL